MKFPREVLQCLILPLDPKASYHVPDKRKYCYIKLNWNVKYIFYWISTLNEWGSKLLVILKNKFIQRNIYDVMLNILKWVYKKRVNAYEYLLIKWKFYSVLKSSDHICCSSIFQIKFCSHKFHCISLAYIYFCPLE